MVTEILPDLSVCVATGGAGAEDHLEALFATADPLAVEVVVVVAAASGTAPALAARFPEALIYELDDAVAASARLNHALRLARGRYLALADETVICRSNALERLIDFLDDHPEAGLCGPRLALPAGRPARSAGLEPGALGLLSEHTGLAAAWPGAPWLRRYRLLDWDRSWSREVDWLSAAFLVFRREVLDDIGPLCEGLSRRYAALDFCRRARRAGWHLHYRHDAEMMVAAALPDEEPGRIGEAGRYLLRRWFGRR